MDQRKEGASVKKKSKVMFREDHKFSITGEVFIKVGKNLSKEDVISNPDRHVKNLVVDSASILLARWANMSASTGTHVPGLTYLGIGIGSDGWDKFNPPLPTATTTVLVDEVGRVARTTSATPFVDGTGTSTSTPTPIVDFEFSFPGDPVSGIDAVLVEMGMFGGDGAEVTDGGTMFNYLTFSAISKPADAELTIIWRVNFLPEGVS